MNDTEATRLLDRLAQTFPDEPAPVHALLEASRGAQRTRTRRTIAGAVVAVALVLGSGAVVQQGMDGGDSVPRPDTVAEPPIVPDGKRLVGIGRVVVAVPESWGTQQIRCGRPLRDTVYFQARFLLCLGVPQQGVSSVLLMDATSEAGQMAVAFATTEATVNGIDVLRGPSAECPDTGGCLASSYSEVVAVPGQGVVLAVPLGGDDGGVLESLQLLPEGYTTVPYIEPGTRSSVATDALGEAGLDTDLNAPDMDVAVTGTEPVGGSVVKVGSTVMFAAFDDRGGSIVPCEMTLTQTDNVQVVPLAGSSRELKLASATPITVDIEGDCPADLAVSGAVVSGSGTRLGEQTDGTRPLVLSPRATHLVLTYQPCAETAPGCRGPTRLFPVQLHSPTRTATQSPLPELTPTEGDMRLVRDFVAFAVDPSSTTAAAIPFAPLVQLGLGSDIKATLDKAETPEPSAWVLDVEYFQGYLGPFSALELLQRHAREAKSQSVQPSGGAFQVSVGDHPHCVGTPVPAPRGLEDHRRVSVRPSEKSIDSCLSWFSVDLFVNKAGRISAGTLDVWEP